MAISVKLNPQTKSKVNSKAKALNISEEKYLQNEIEDLYRDKPISSDKKQDESLKIIWILDDFIIHKYDNLKNIKATQESLNLLGIIFNNRWLLFGFLFPGLSIFSLLILGVFYPDNESVLILAMLLFVSTIICFIYIVVNRISTFYSLYKDVKRKAIKRTLVYNPEEYQQVIYELGENFYEQDLYREEIRFEIAIRERKRRSSILKKATPLIAIFLVAIGVYIFGLPKDSTEIELLYGTVAGISGIVFVTRVVFDIYSELLDEDLKIYETCVSILQKAQAIAKEEELDAVKAYDIAKSYDDEAIPFDAVVPDAEGMH